MWIMLLTFLFTFFAFFSVCPEPSKPCKAHAFFPQRVSNHCQSLRRTFSEISTKFDAAVPTSDPSQSRIKSDTRLHIKGRKNQHVLPAACSFVHWLPRYATNIVYLSITLLQLLYRWQHQFRKLWITPPRKYYWKYVPVTVFILYVTRSENTVNLLNTLKINMHCGIPQELHGT
jgi:hypothetical protein